MGKFSSRLPRYRSQKPISRHPGQPGLSYEHIDIFANKRVARRDRGNRASPVDRARMKRPAVTKASKVKRSIFVYIKRLQCFHRSLSNHLKTILK